MRIAVVGTGVSGLVAARELAREHDLDVFEANERIGGHTNTLLVDDPDVGELPVDTGFIVFNRRTYPNFCRLMAELGVAERDSDMSFSVRNARTGLGYNGTSLNQLFAQRSNLLRPRFLRMVREILRFYREAPALLAAGEEELTLGDYLRSGGYGRTFIEEHLMPMGAAVWSATPEVMQAFPLVFLLRFFHNHGFLQVDERPQWLVLEGGSRSYLEPITEGYRDRIRTGTPVVQVTRERSGEGRLVRVRTAAGEERLYDRVVLACHSDQALRMLADATPLEREVLSAFEYQPNEAVLHTDERLMPLRPRAWASWNYHVTDPPARLSTVTYWMNMLQGLEVPTNYFVTLNRTADIRPERVLKVIQYHHPIFTRAAVAAQKRHDEVDGVEGVHFCGAYWSYGFHEDGVRSGLAVARNLSREVGGAVPELLEVEEVGA